MILEALPHLFGRPGQALALVALLQASVGLVAADAGHAAELPERARAAFAETLADPDSYDPMACHINVQDLLRALRRKGESPRRWNVVYLSSFVTDKTIGRYFSGRGIDPLRPRLGPYSMMPIHWNFHVFLESGGWVLDLDYTDAPTPMRLREYLDAQFGRENLRKIGVRVYRGDRYLRRYSDEVPNDPGTPMRNWAWHLSDGGGVPLIPVLEWARGSAP